MRLVVVVLLLAGAASSQGARRGVDAILADHRAALGAFEKVRALGSVATLSGSQGKVEGVESFWRLPDTWLRRIPNAKGGSPRVESFLDGVALASAGFTERWRPNQRTTRGAYYAMKALAEPFPLRPYFEDVAARKGLGIAYTEGYEVLTGPRDVYGVRPLYLLDPKSHLLRAIRFEEKENEPFAQVTFDQHRAVEGVVLPHALYVAYRVILQDPNERRKMRAKDAAHWERVVRWTVNPDLSGVRFEMPAPPPRMDAGFERRVIATGPNPYEAAAGDFDGDGKIDLAAACEAALYVHFGGDLDRPKRVPLGGGQLRGLAVEDLDLDGRPELITSCTFEPAEQYLLVTFDAQRHYEKEVIYGAPHFARAIRAVDLDLDGLGDLVACGFASQTLELKFGNGAKGVRVTGTRWPLATKSHPFRRGLGLDVGDLDGDGILDIGVADGERVVLFMGRPNLAFQPVHELKSLRPVAVRFADLDGDGRLDVLVANFHPLQEIRHDLAVFLRRGEELVPQPPVDAGRGLQSVDVGDFDGDGHLDVAAASSRSGQVWVLPGDGTGKLGKPRKYASGLGTVQVQAVDFDGDGRDDLLAVNRIDDTLALFRNSGTFEPRPRSRPARARPVPIGMDDVSFRLEGLSDPYEFVGEFRIPAEIEDPSGITALGGINTQLVFVSDKRSALFRATLDRSKNRLLIGPPIPLRGLENERLDLEGLAFDAWTGNLFLACEHDSTILRATLFGQVLRRVPTGVPVVGNDGIEAIALRRKKDGTPLLYVFKERMALTGVQPPVFVFALKDEPFVLEKRLGPVPLPHALVDQSGAAVLGQRLFVLSRMERAVLELGFQGDGFAPEVKSASYAELVLEHLGLRYEKPPLYGMAEGIAVDRARGDLFLLFDNNRKEVGLPGRNRGREGRLLWFRNLGGAQRSVRTERVVVRQILVRKDAPGAAETAAEIHRRALAGEDFEKLAAEFGGSLLRVVADTRTPGPGERRMEDLPVALGRLVFSLEVGEVGLCEYEKIESPLGWHIVQRIE